MTDSQTPLQTGGEVTFLSLRLIPLLGLTVRSSSPESCVNLTLWRGVELEEREIWVAPFVCVEPSSSGTMGSVLGTLMLSPRIRCSVRKSVSMHQVKKCNTNHLDSL